MVFDMNKLLILGAGGHGKVVAETALLTGKWNEVSFLDDKYKNLNNEKNVVGVLNEYIKFKDIYDDAFVAIGKNYLRLMWINKLLNSGYNVPKIVHPFSFISGKCKIGFGTIVMAGVVVNTNTEVKNGCILNTSISVNHDCVINDGVHLSPGVHIGGTTIIGEKSWICIGANVSNNLSIGRNVVVAAGASVIKNIDDNVMVAGVPATVKKIRSEDNE